MGKLIDLTGETFGRLTVIKKSYPDKWGAPTWQCICSCGAVSCYNGHNLRRGDTTSCGCLKTELITKHNMHKTSTYSSWAKMISRCLNPNNDNYYLYGGRGITVCERWLDFINFYNDMGDRPKGKTIDRIESDKGYYKDNCRWATNNEQARNRRTTKLNQSDVDNIRLLSKNKTSIKSLMHLFNMSHTSIWNIIHHKKWKED